MRQRVVCHADCVENHARCPDVPHVVRGDAFGGATLSTQAGGWGGLAVPEAHLVRARELMRTHLDSEVSAHGTPA